jgi:hypothetical protein
VLGQRGKTLKIMSSNEGDNIFSDEGIREKYLA